jgi:ubiquinone/menaquinone biosynthesis C-methylase UbiE
MAKNPTSWGPVAPWYKKHLEEPDTYHSQVVLPNLTRMMEVKKGEQVFDLACGEGFFSRAFASLGAVVSGADIAPELVLLAKKSIPMGTFTTTPSHNLSGFKSNSFSKIACVLALQNIEKVRETLAECNRILVSGGTMYIVINHPAFRIPKSSSWGFDEMSRVQYRRMDSYMKETKEKIVMHPGEKESAQTVSFHRPLQYYFKAFSGAGFAVTRLEEWISHRESEEGPRKAAEDVARKEFPLFMAIELVKLKSL